MSWLFGWGPNAPTGSMATTTVYVPTITAATTSTNHWAMQNAMLQQQTTQAMLNYMAQAQQAAAQPQLGGLLPMEVTPLPPFAERVERFLASFAGTISLPDRTRLAFDGKGNCRIEDAEARVIYRANRVREFNRFINASDLIEDFISECKRLGLRRKDFLGLPIGLFIHWLVIKSAEADGEDPPPEVPRLEAGVLALAPPRRPRCQACGRFMLVAVRDAGLGHCRPKCYAKALAHVS